MKGAAMPDRPLPAPLRQAARAPNRRMLGRLFDAWFGRGYGSSAGPRVLILYDPRVVAFASAYPFVIHAGAFMARYGAQVRFFPTARALRDGVPDRFLGATHVVAQTWLTEPAAHHAQVAELLPTRFAGARTAYLDSSANADIRLAAPFADVDLYFKKSLFRDRAEHLQPTRGHTNLSEYYGDLLGIAQEKVDWRVPPAILPRLRLAPNFLTAPALAHGFLAAPAPPEGTRSIDLHARLGGADRDGWYGAMRRSALTAAEGLGSVTGTGIPRARFMAELQASKLCFSPFGYGELCWRDLEAIHAGAVLLKPDMGHLDSTPNLYEDGETYVALRWDFSDLADKAAALLADPDRRAHIARTAYARARAYLLRDGPVEAFAPLFA